MKTPTRIQPLESHAAHPGGSPGHPQDAALARQIAAGDEAAFERLYARFRHRIYAYALRRLRNPCDAEDVTQEVFLQVHRSIGSYGGRSRLSTWLFGIAHHETCNRLRRHQPNTTSIDEATAATVPSPAPSPERCAEARRALGRCREALENRMSESQQHTFHLRYERHQSVAQIARQLGKSTHAVKIGLFRSRRMLMEAEPELASA